jgi:hypothetical protein
VGLDSRSVEIQAHNLIAARRYAEAEAVLRAALGNGGPVPLWRMLAASLRHQARPAEARPIQEMLVDSVPGDVAMRFELAETLLLLGEFDRGWREYHYRYQLPHTTRIERKVQKPRWNGRPIPGQTLLIHDEQGFGDTFQFMRMTAWARARSQARVVLEINPEMASLARRMGGFDLLTLRGDLPPAFDVHCEMMSLPMAMGLTLSDLPGEPMPYLAPDPERLARWRERLGGLTGPLVALAWAGRPTHLNDANRSISLPMLAPLAASGATFLSIQKGPAESAAASPPDGMTVVNLSPEIRDFEDTAAILQVADLLISVDSSPVHLAGALGRPAWVLLPFSPDWRWLMGREDTPWYPSTRLFRQSAPGDWTDAIQRMARELGSWPRSA